MADANVLDKVDSYLTFNFRRNMVKKKIPSHTKAKSVLGNVPTFSPQKKIRGRSFQKTEAAFTEWETEDSATI